MPAVGRRRYRKGGMLPVKLRSFFRRLKAHCYRLFFGIKRQAVLHLSKPFFGNDEIGLKLVAAGHFIEFCKTGNEAEISFPRIDHPDEPVYLFVTEKAIEAGQQAVHGERQALHGLGRQQ
jgi:hypothetical protein